MACNCEQLAAELAAIKLLLGQFKPMTQEEVLRIVGGNLKLQDGPDGLTSLFLGGVGGGAIGSFHKGLPQSKFDDLSRAAANFGRIEALLQQIQAQQQQIKSIESVLNQTQTKVQQIDNKVIDIYESAIRSGASADEAKRIATDARDRLSGYPTRQEVKQQVQSVETTANGAATLANKANDQAIRAYERTIALGGTVEDALDAARIAKEDAWQAKSQSGQALSNAGQALTESRDAKGAAGAAAGKADDAARAAGKASGAADDAARVAKGALGKADDALGTARKGLAGIGEAIQRSKFAENMAKFAESNAGKALGMAANALMIIGGISMIVDFLMSIYNEFRLSARFNLLEQRMTFEENLSGRILSALTKIESDVKAANNLSAKAMAESSATSKEVSLLNLRFSELRSELDKKIRDLRTLIDAALANFNRLQAEISAYVASIPKVIDEKISAAVTGLKSAYDKALALLEQKITELQKELAAMGDIANQVISAINPRLTAIEQQLRGLGTGSNPTDINPVLAAINSAKSDIIRNLEPLLDRAGYYNKVTITEQSLSQIRQELQKAQREVADLKSGVFFGNLAKQDTTAIQAKLNDALQRLSILRDRSELNHNVITTTVTKQNASLSGQVQDLTQTVTTTSTQTPTTTSQGFKATDIINPVNLAMGVAFADLGRQLIQRIDTKTAQIPAQVIPPIINATANNVGTCRYDAARVNRIDQNTDEVEGLIRDTNLRTRKIDATTTATAGAVAAHATSWFGWVNNVWGQFYNQFVKVRDWLLNDRVINILNLIFNLHNAMMLSSNVAQSIIWAVDGVLRLLGVELKDSEGNDIGLSQRISQTITNLANQAFGEENVAEAKAQFALLSTIYRSAVNVIYGVTGLFQSMRMIVDTIAEYVGRIGNALKRDAVVADNNYQWMREDFWSRVQDTTRFEKFYRGVENAETVTGTVSMVTGDIQSVSDTVRSFDDQRDQIVAEAKRAQDAAGDIDPSTFTRSGTGYSQDSPLPADTVVATEAEAAISSEPRVSLTDPKLGQP